MLQPYDRTCRSIEAADRLLELSLQPWERQLRLLETVPGIDAAAPARS